MQQQRVERNHVQEEDHRDDSGNIDSEKVARALAHSGECTGRRLADR